jgi:hypothetical protein
MSHTASLTLQGIGTVASILLGFSVVYATYVWSTSRSANVAAEALEIKYSQDVQSSLTLIGANKHFFKRYGVELTEFMAGYPKTESWNVGGP